MRICYLANGQFIHAHRWLRYFSERGHEMYLVSFAPMEARHIQAVEATGARYLGDVGSFHLKRFWHTGGDLLTLRRLLSRERIDVLHAHFLGAGAWYAALSNFHPFVLTIMGGDICGQDWKPGDDVRERILSPLALRKADLITCWSQGLTHAVRRFARPETPVEVVHGGVNIDRFQPGPRPTYLLERLGLPYDAKIVLSPRLMKPLYNLDTVALAAREVCTKDSSVYFLFAYLPDASNPAFESRVREIVASDPTTANRVQFIGGIPHDEMADYYRLADVTVSVPSTDGTPMSVLESMACGTPVVVSRIQDYDSHYIEPNVTVLDTPLGDESALAGTVVRLLNDKTLRSELTVEARRRVVETGSYEAQMSHMRELYIELVKGGLTSVS